MVKAKDPAAKAVGYSTKAAAGQDSIGAGITACDDSPTLDHASGVPTDHLGGGKNDCDAEAECHTFAHTDELPMGIQGLGMILRL